MRGGGGGMGGGGMQRSIVIRWVSALPIKITGGSAGWVRPVAIIEDD